MSNASFNHFNTLRNPIVSEKSHNAMGGNNQYTFKVERSASKQQIREAIEAIFEVRVEKIQVINLPGKEKRRGARVGFRSGYRKAVIRLAEGQTLAGIGAEG